MRVARIASLLTISVGLGIVIACSATHDDAETSDQQASALTATCPRTAVLTPGTTYQWWTGIQILVPRSIPLVGGCTVLPSSATATLSWASADTCTYGPASTTQCSTELVLQSCTSGLSSGQIEPPTLQMLLTANNNAPIAPLSISEAVDDGDPCTSDTCVFNRFGGGYRVTHTPVTDGTSCEDGNYCNGHETCSAGQCVAGAAPTITSSGCNDCACDSSGRVVCTPVTGTLACPAPSAPPPSYGGGSVPSSVGAGAMWLYGAGGPQTGVTTGTIDTTRTTVIRGHVFDPSGASLTSTNPATVSIVNHPEFGQTQTRADGWFDMAVNGGATYVVDIEPPAGTSYLPLQRQAFTRWNDYAVLKDVYFTAADPKALTVSFPTSSGTLLQGSMKTDDGARTPYVYIPAGTSATVNGQALGSNKTLRLTEFTTGPTGPNAMPGDLPATSAYTYAVEATVDGYAPSSTIAFSSPVYFYLDDFLHFPPSSAGCSVPDGGVGDNGDAGDAGTCVPTGYYDRTRGQWVATPNGTVVTLTANGTNGCSTAPLCVSPALPDISADEIAKLAATVMSSSSCWPTPGAQCQVWRVPLTHFSPYDLNWGYSLPVGAVPPSAPPPTGNGPVGDGCKVAAGSIIECENQILADEIAVPGTPFKLRYQSEKQRGRASWLTIPITGPTPPPANVTKVYVDIDIAGRHLEFTPPPANGAQYGANESIVWSWDRADAYGRYVPYGATAHIAIGYAYPAQNGGYGNPFGFGYHEQSALVSGNRSARELVEWQFEDASVGTLDATTVGLGGWTLSPHHVYDPSSGTLYAGNGRRITGSSAAAVANYLANGSNDFNVQDVATGWDAQPSSSGQTTNAATVYIADTYSEQIARFDGKTLAFSTFAGGPHAPGWQDNTLATNIGINATGIAVAPDGSVYISETENAGAVAAIRRAFRSGSQTLVTTVAGYTANGTTAPPAGFGGDGKPATSAAARLKQPAGLTVARDGTLYFADSGNFRIRRVGTDGILQTVAGNGTPSGATNPPVPGRATASPISPIDVAVAPDGTLYISDTGTCRILAVGPDGMLRTVVGSTATATACGTDSTSGVLAAAATFAGFPTKPNLDVGPDGSIYFFDSGGKVYTVSGDGYLVLIAGGGSVGSQGYVPPGTLATQAAFRALAGIAIGQDHALYIGNGSTATLFVEQITSPFPTFAGGNIVVDPNGDDVYQMDAKGRHQVTYDAETNAALETFAYDDAASPSLGYVSTIKDASGNTTRIGYVANGTASVCASATNPPPGGAMCAQAGQSGCASVCIVAPFGQATYLAFDANGYLRNVTTPHDTQSPPTAETFAMTYYTGAQAGLLQTLTDPEGKTHSFAFDADGLLVRDATPLSGSAATTLQRTPIVNGWKVARATPEGRTTTYTEAMNAVSNASVPVPGAGVAQQNGIHEQRTMFTPSGAEVDFDRGPDRATTKSWASAGYATVENVAADPFFGSAGAYVSAKNVSTTGGLSYTVQTTRSYTYGSNPTWQTWTTKTDTSAIHAAGTSVDGKAWTRTVDRSARTITYASPSYSMIETYNAAGQITNVALGNGARSATPFSPLSYNYDPATGLLDNESRGQRTYSLSYDSQGYPQSVTLPTTDVIKLWHDPTGRLTRQVLADGTTALNLDHNLNGDVNSVTLPGLGPSGSDNPLTHSLSWSSWNGTDLMSTYQPPSSGATSYSYDHDGLLLFTAQPDNTISRIPDAFGRTGTVTDPTSVTITYGYDAADRVSTLVTTDGERVDFTWDGPLMTGLAWSGPVAGSVTKQYGNDFRLTSETVAAPAAVDGATAANATTTLTYDSDGLLKTEELSDGQVSATLTVESRDPQTGLVRTVQTGNLSEVYTYNTYGEIASITYSYLNNVLYSVTYDSIVSPRDSLGRVHTKSESIVQCAATQGCTVGTSESHTATYGYDPLMHLTSATNDGVSTTYQYDSDGNRISVNNGPSSNCGGVESRNEHCYDDQDKLLLYASPTNGPTSYQYTLNGTLQFATFAATKLTFGYDLFGTLRSYANSATGTGIAYTNDGAHRRVARAKVVSGTPTTVQRFLYRDGRHIVAELDGATTAGLVSAFGYGIGSETPDLMLRTTGVPHGVYRLVTDQLGSVRLVVNVSTGVIVQRIDYDEFGQPTVAYDALSGPTQYPNLFVQPFGFAGGLYDGSTGLVRFGTRDYDASIGRWTAKDTALFLGGWNMYAYVVDPVNLRDPSGHAGFDPTNPLCWISPFVCAFLPPGGASSATPSGGPTADAGFPAGAPPAAGAAGGPEPAAGQDAEPICRDVRPLPYCDLAGSGGCNKRTGKKRCTYKCDSGEECNRPVDCGPGNWDPACPSQAWCN